MAGKDDTPGKRKDRSVDEILGRSAWLLEEGVADEVMRAPRSSGKPSEEESDAAGNEAQEEGDE